MLCPDHGNITLHSESGCTYDIRESCGTGVAFGLWLIAVFNHFRYSDTGKKRYANGFEVCPGQMPYRIETLIFSFELSTSFEAFAMKLPISEDCPLILPIRVRSKLRHRKHCVNARELFHLPAKARPVLESSYQIELSSSLSALNTNRYTAKWFHSPNKTSTTPIKTSSVDRTQQTFALKVTRTFVQF